MAVSDERWWDREIEPPNLAKLTGDLRTHYGVTRMLIGCKGDVNHLRGYHRSREWILNSEYSRDGASDYSVTATLDKTGDGRWLCALDFQTRGGVPELIEVCKRLDAAVKADRLPQIREWYGNADGDRVVDGWDNLRDRAASSDSSHLWHLHISFFRSRANWDHSLLFDVLTGADMLDKTQTSWLFNASATITQLAQGLDTAPIRNPDGTTRTITLTQSAAIRRIDAATAKIDGLVKTVQLLAEAVNAGGGNLDTAVVLARIDERAAEDAERDAVTARRIAELEADNAALREQLAAIPDAVADELHQRTAD